MKTLRTNTKEYKKLIRAEILNAIDTTGTEFNETEKDKMLYFAYRFESEFNFLNNKRKYPNLQNRISEYLQGLPINLPYNYYDIIEMAKRTKTYKPEIEQKILDNYWSFMAYQILIYCKELNIPL